MSDLASLESSRTSGWKFTSLQTLIKSSHTNGYTVKSLSLLTMQTLVRFLEAACFVINPCFQETPHVEAIDSFPVQMISFKLGGINSLRCFIGCWKYFKSIGRNLVPIHLLISKVAKFKGVWQLFLVHWQVSLYNVCDILEFYKSVKTVNSIMNWPVQSASSDKLNRKWQALLIQACIKQELLRVDESSKIFESTRESMRVYES